MQETSNNRNLNSMDTWTGGQCLNPVETTSPYVSQLALTTDVNICESSMSSHCIIIMVVS